MARDVERLKPSALVGAAQEFTDDVRSVLRKHGIAAVAISDMDATSVPGFERFDGCDIEVPAHPRIEILTSGTPAPEALRHQLRMIAKYHVGVHMLASSGPTTCCRCRR